MRSLLHFRWRTAATATATLAVAASLLAPSAPAAALEGADDTRPCTIGWDGGAGTDLWNDAANWTGDRVPHVDDDACISRDVAPPMVRLTGVSSKTVNSLRADLRVVVELEGPATFKMVTASTVSRLAVTSGNVQVEDQLEVLRVVQTGGQVGGPGDIRAGRYD